MNKELTPMMELIEQLEKEIKFINEDDSREDRYYQQGLKLAYAKAFELLPKEKQVIEDAYSQNCTYFSCKEKKSGCKCGEKYYEINFKQSK